jgi:hypothetical protein
MAAAAAKRPWAWPPVACMPCLQQLPPLPRLPENVRQRPHLLAGVKHAVTGGAADGGLRAGADLRVAGPARQQLQRLLA